MLARLESLPPSPMRDMIASMLKGANQDALFDQVARIFMIEGMLGVRPTGKTPLPILARQHPEIVDRLPSGFFNPRSKSRLYSGIKYGVYSVLKHGQEEALQDIFAGLTRKGGLPTKPLAYRVGETLAKTDKPITEMSIQNLASAYAKRRALDYIKAKKDSDDLGTPTSTVLGDNLTLGDVLQNTQDYSIVQAVFGSPEGRKALEKLESAVMSELSSNGQKAVWSAILHDPSLIGARSESVASAALAEALAEKGYHITRQRAGQIWREVLNTVREVSSDHTDVLDTLEHTRSVRQILDPGNIGRYAAWKVARIHRSRTAGLDDVDTSWGSFIKTLPVHEESKIHANSVRILKSLDAGDKVEITYYDSQRGGEVKTVRTVVHPWSYHTWSSRPIVSIAPKGAIRPSNRMMANGMIKDYGDQVYWQPTGSSQIKPIIRLKRV
jgi:hypothetical protein